LENFIIIKKKKKNKNILKKIKKKKKKKNKKILNKIKKKKVCNYNNEYIKNINRLIYTLVFYCKLLNLCCYVLIILL